LHNKVVFRAAQSLINSGFGTLRFNFRGTGVSSGKHDYGVGETQDFRAAMDETERRGGLPMVAGGFSFGSAMALKAIAGDPLVVAYIGVGLPVASESAREVPLPSVPSLFVVGMHDTFGPPRQLREVLGGSYEIVEIPGADHFLEGKLDVLEQAITTFLAGLALPARVTCPGRRCPPRRAATCSCSLAGLSRRISWERRRRGCCPTVPRRSERRAPSSSRCASKEIFEAVSGRSRPRE